MLKHFPWAGSLLFPEHNPATLTHVSRSMIPQGETTNDASLISSLSAVGKCRPRQSRRVLVIATLIILIAAFLRLATLGQEAVDGDELFSRRIAVLSIGQMLPAVRADLVHPPLYYFVLKTGTTLWGKSALGIRLWSILFGLLVIPMAVLCGFSLAGSRYSGLLAAAMLAVNQHMIFYSQQARSYMLYVFLIMLLWVWVARLNQNDNPTSWFWGVGLLLVAALVYTHYIAAVYVTCVLVAIVISNVPTRTKLLSALISVVGALSFIPWLFAVLGIYKQKHGIGTNLDWQGHPSLYDLKAVLGSPVGIMDYRGATTIASMLVALLFVCAFLLKDKDRSLRNSPLLLSLIFCSFMTPLVMFVLSTGPFGLPLFGLRHLLPSVAGITLICAYGLEKLVMRSPRLRVAACCIGAYLLICLGTTSVLHEIIQRPVRQPYDRIAQQAHTLASSGNKIYAIWGYGVAEPVNFYCRTKCVDPLPDGLDALPGSFYLLYRPDEPKEDLVYQSLLRWGFSAYPMTYFTSGRPSSWGTQMVLLRHGPSKITATSGPAH